MTDDIMMQDEQNITQKHSGFGIASFIIAIIQGVTTAVVVILASVFAAKEPQSENEVALAIIGLAIFGGIFAHLVGLGLGIAGVVQKDRKKVFSILGLIFNIVAVITIALLMIIGLTVGQNH